MTETSLLILLATLLTVVPLAAALLRRRQLRQRQQHRQLRAILIIRQLQQLMSLLQQHRGMTSLLLNGDRGKARELADKQALIRDGFEALQKAYTAELMTPARWRRIGEYWQRIEQQIETMTPDESFQRHSDLIRQLLFLIGDVAEHGQLNVLGNGADHSTSPLWTDLPATAEAIGQARAVGAGVAAAGRCNSVARIKLRYLRQQVEDALQRLRGTRLDDDRFDHKVEKFLDVLERKLLQPETPDISAEHYFGLASEALEAVYAVFEGSSTRLQRRLQQGA